MEYLGEDISRATTIYRLGRDESDAIWRLIYALTRTPRDRRFAAESEYQALVSEGIAAMNHLSKLLEAGSVKVTFEPVEVRLP